MSKKIKDEDIDENVYLGLRAAPRPQAAMTRPKGPEQQIINTPHRAAEPKRQPGGNRFRFARNRGRIGLRRRRVGLHRHEFRKPVSVYHHSDTGAGVGDLLSEAMAYPSHHRAGAAAEIHGKGHSAFREHHQVGISHPHHHRDLWFLAARQNQKMVCKTPGI